MDEADVIMELEATGALKRGHFKLSSGRHSEAYVQCALLLVDPARAVEMGRELAGRIPTDVDLVLCPALGALIIGFTVALALDTGMIFAERVDGKMALRRGFCVPPGARVLIVEDVITTGGSVLELVRLVEEEGASVAGLASIIDRSEHALEGYSSYSLLKLDVESFTPEECELCKQGKQIDSPGSRYLA